MATEITVILRTGSGEICRVKSSDALRRLALHWSYVVNNRRRWSRDAESRQHVRKEATSALKELGISRRHLRQLALSGIIEVSIPFRGEEIGWEARVLPWEYLLSAATKPFRGDHSVTIVRHLNVRRRSSRRQPESYVIIETAPGEFREFYDFQAERELIEASLTGLRPMDGIRDPTKSKLVSTLKSSAPDVIHLTGIDAHLGHQLERKSVSPGKTRSSREVLDGVCLSHSRRKVEIVLAQEMAVHLNAGNPKPLLCGLNCWYSGARFAPMCVAEGCSAALGFQNTFDDRVAELFFVSFYQAWLSSQRDVLEAFLHAWQAVKPFGEKLRGTGVTLWSASSLVRKSSSLTRMKPNREGIRKSRELYNVQKREKLRTARPADPGKDSIRDLIGVKVKPRENINYSMLHNRGSLLEEFYFWLKNPTMTNGPVPANEGVGATLSLVQDIEVEIVLNVGADSFPYRTKFMLSRDSPQIDLADVTLEAADGNPAGGVRVPLISGLARSVDERMHTSLYINVKWHDQILYRHTHSVSLAPVDEWNFDVAGNCWFPSFIQPRDPAIIQIVDSAQKYLRCLEDDPTAGFCGYQAADVDPQVQAIWSAIMYDYRLDYVSPPPVYSDNAQRLRTPTQVLREKRGTCIDLAVLFASCLEWIELFPVIFMSEFHAFPGYWASEKAHEEFHTVSRKRTSGSEQPVFDSPQKPWESGPDNYHEVRSFIDNLDLSPIETVSLTSRSSFMGAYHEALQYFSVENPHHVDPENGDRDPEQGIGSFETMFDVVIARPDVTPLPVWIPDSR